ncbi:hypothetical protein C8R44DRAFT_752653 [Mycena epipterygia]|nr:hypothetical protein C8R44DRAFT_752653 [Mycena epipterygia]
MVPNSESCRSITAEMKDETGTRRTWGKVVAQFALRRTDPPVLRDLMPQAVGSSREVHGAPHCAREGSLRQSRAQSAQWWIPWGREGEARRKVEREGELRREEGVEGAVARALSAPDEGGIIESSASSKVTSSVHPNTSYRPLRRDRSQQPRARRSLMSLLWLLSPTGIGNV